MPYLVVKDELPSNAKVQSCLRTPLTGGGLIGPAAIGAWVAAGALSQAKGSDGVVTEADLMSMFLHRPTVRRLAAFLVEAGLWHREGHHCLRCPPVAAGSFLFHDWFDNGGYKPGVVHETQRRKNRELSSPVLRAAVWERDCIDDPAVAKVGRCRYCGHEVLLSDRKSAFRPHLDHVDPDRADGLKNLVLACATCNKRKSNRTLEDAGMILLPPPTRTAESSGKSNGKSE
jgi:5-methylcytosine-specific restriction endonuclease McrA